MILLTLLMLLFSCQPESQNKSEASSFAEICGRDGLPAYRARVPATWERRESPGPRTDTTQALCEFFIDNEIRITIHNFPRTPIPPEAQIARWVRQFQKLDDQNIHYWVYGGFVGLAFEGEGLFQGKPTQIYGWAMQLAPEHARNLDRDDLKADYTIKAVGPTHLMESHKKEILQFARSFELIAEIPGDL